MAFRDNRQERPMYYLNIRKQTKTLPRYHDRNEAFNTFVFTKQKKKMHGTTDILGSKKKKRALPRYKDRLHLSSTL